MVELQGLLDTEDLKFCTTENSFIWVSNTTTPRHHKLKLSKHFMTGLVEFSFYTEEFRLDSLVQILSEGPHSI